MNQLFAAIAMDVTGDRETGGRVHVEETKPDVKQAILWTREARNSGVEPITIVNCWGKTGLLPEAAVEVDERVQSDIFAELAVMLTEFAAVIRN